MPPEAKPQPKTDASGVPWCDNACSYRPGGNRSAINTCGYPCVVPTMICPIAVRAMAAELAHIKEAARTRPFTAVGIVWEETQPVPKCTGDCRRFSDGHMEPNPACPAHGHLAQCTCGGGYNPDNGQEEYILNPDCPIHRQFANPQAQEK